MKRKIIEKEIKRLRNEVQGLSLLKKRERAIFELKMAQICILEKVLEVDENGRYIKDSSSSINRY